MRDFYPDDMHTRRALFGAWREAAWNAGFVEYDACVVESLELLKRKGGEEIVDQIYAFQDKSGRDLALRPEMTPTLARMLAEREGSLVFPVRWFTIAQCFRYERMTRGRKREHYQWNLDIVGTDSVAAEAEVIATAAAALRGLGLTAEHVRVHFNNRALLSDLLASLGIPAEHHAATFLALDKRGKIEDSAIEELLAKEGVGPDAAKRVFELLALRSLDDVARLLPAGASSVDAVQRFLEFAAASGVAPVLEFDLSVIRGLAYYTGIVFEAFDVNRKFRAIFGGGRYDNLLAMVGGSPRSGVGLGFGDVVVGELLADLGITAEDRRTAHLQVGFMAPELQSLAVRVAAGFRRDGVATEVAFRAESPKAFFGRASKSGCREAVYIGPDDVARGALRVKNMATREERTVPLS